MSSKVLAELSAKFRGVWPWPVHRVVVQFMPLSNPLRLPTILVRVEVVSLGFGGIVILTASFIAQKRELRKYWLTCKVSW